MTTSLHINSAGRAFCGLAMVLACAVLVSGCDFFFGGNNNDDADAGGSDTALPDNDAGNGTCDIAALAAQCPLASRPLFGNDAISRCALLDESGGYTSGLDAGLCQGDGVCVVACNFENPCECGVDRITNDGVFCTDCSAAAACGNAICEPGEDNGSCDLDCGSSCSAGTVRCNADVVEECIGGAWRQSPCGPGQTCSLLADRSSAYCAAEAAPYDPTLPDIAAAVVPARDWRAIAFPHLPLTCDAATEASRVDCRFENFLFDGTRSLLIGTNGRVLLNNQSGEFETWPAALGGAWEFHDYAVEACQGERLPRVADLRSGAFVALDPVVDDVILSTCEYATVSADGQRAVASMKIDDRPLVVVWELPSGDVYRVLRYESPTDAGLVTVGVRVSDHGELALETRQAVFSPPPRRTITVVWNVEAGTYAGIYESEVTALRPGHLGWLLDRSYISLDASGSWERPVQDGTQLLGFTPDGQYVWGHSVDPYGIERLTLFDADSGRVYHRYPFADSGTNAGGQDPSAPRVLFSRSGDLLKINGSLYSSIPLP
jgi:hypothetical protein